MASLILSFCLLTALTYSSASAQEHVNRPLPGSVSVPSQEDYSYAGDQTASEIPQRKGNEISVKSPSYVRLWNFAKETAGDGLGVFLAKGSQIPPPEERLWLGRGSRPGEIREYAEFEPGNFQLFVISDASRQGAMVELPREFQPDSGNMLSNRLSLQTRPGTYHTVLLFDDGGELRAKVLADSEILPKKLRLFNFTNEFSPDISALSRNGAVLIAESLGQEQTVAVPNSAGVLTLEIAYPTGVEGFVGRMNVECDFSQVRSCSLMVAYDRYNRLSVRAVEDAPFFEGE